MATVVPTVVHGSGGMHLTALLVCEELSVIRGRVYYFLKSHCGFLKSIHHQTAQVLLFKCMCVLVPLWLSTGNFIFNSGK